MRWTLESLGTLFARRWANSLIAEHTVLCARRSASGCTVARYTVCNKLCADLSIFDRNSGGAGFSQSERIKRNPKEPHMKSYKIMRNHMKSYEIARSSYEPHCKSFETSQTAQWNEPIKSESACMRYTRLYSEGFCVCGKSLCVQQEKKRKVIMRRCPAVNRKCSRTWNFRDFQCYNKDRRMLT